MPSTAGILEPSSASEPTWLTRLPSGRDLERSELRELAVTVARVEAYWRPLVRHNGAERHFVQLHRDLHLDVWLICWTNQQETGLHDHDVSSGAVHVCIGDLVEDRLELREGTFQRVSVTRPQAMTFDFDSSHVHCLRHPEGRPPRRLDSCLLASALAHGLLRRQREWPPTTNVRHLRRRDSCGVRVVGVLAPPKQAAALTERGRPAGAVIERRGPSCRTCDIS